MQEQTKPTTVEIDTLAQIYVEAQAEAEKAQDAANNIKASLLQMVTEHGFIPRRATKSRRLEGEVWQVTLSKGHRVEVKDGAATRLRDALRAIGLARFFRRLFIREAIYVLADGAQELMAKPLPAKATDPESIRILFAEAVSIESQSPTLKVEPIKKEKE